MTSLKLFRGIAVSSARRDATIRKIETDGLIGDEGKWSIVHQHPGDVEVLFAITDLGTGTTRPKDAELPKVACACGEPDGASYYASKHNRSAENDAPLIVEFEAPISDIAVDGRDFLFTVFQFGKPDAARPYLKTIFGERALRYADRAWLCENQDQRIALCDLAIHDPAVIEAHHANPMVVAGRYGTIFRNAFTVICPVTPHRIRAVRTVGPEFRPPRPEIDFRDLLQR